MGQVIFGLDVGFCVLIHAVKGCMFAKTCKNWRFNLDVFSGRCGFLERIVQ